jgi:hypothetical protein
MRARLAAIGMGALLLGGSVGATCNGPTPKATSLETVHERYAAELDQVVVPASGSGCAAPPSGPSAPGGEPFPQTAEAIRALRASGNADEATLAHVTVLEAMIHLQSGRTNLARSDVSAVAEAAPHLRTATGADARDALLAKSYPALVQGWSEIAELQRSGGCSFPEESPDGLEQAGDAIQSELAAARARDALASSDEDSGALYLATSAAIFYVWADKIRDDRCMRRDPEASRACRAADGTTLLERGRALIGAYLPDACHTVPPSGACPASLARYADWYRFLGEEIARGT